MIYNEQNKNSNVCSYWIDMGIAIVSFYLDLIKTVMSWNHSTSIIVP